MDKPFMPVSLNTQAIDTMLKHIQNVTGQLAPLMVAVRQELLAQTEANFADSGRPNWPALAAPTEAQREKKGKWPGQILQMSGALARSVVGTSDERSAMIGVGSEIPYAAIHQFGGQAGRNRKVAIPARPYLPLVNGVLQPQAEVAILELARAHLVKLALGES